MLAIIEPPISLRQLHDMERRLRQVIAKQGAARRHSIQAREEMRAMLSTFIESLATMNVSSTSFQAKIEETARKIKNIERIEDLGPLLIDVMEATRMMTEGTSQVREQLKGMQERVVATEATLARLYEELDSISAQARHDPLTDALNRKGLDDALNREISNLQRRNLPLSICLLDIDDFKTLNDRLGHETGDKALIHLANVARHCMRPNDTLARYGGEEFVILMPDTPLASGIEVMTRLQRELTRMFFLSGNEKVLITFSAGVAQVGRDETGIEAINRADQAMYLAKRAGKNRVMGG
jgi:diguanylate cyclase